MVLDFMAPVDYTETMEEEYPDYSIEFEPPKTRDYTVEDIFNALKQNGFEHLRGEWYSDDGNSIGACILGQAALNLNAANKQNIYEEEPEADFHSVFNQLNRFALPLDHPRRIPQPSMQLGVADTIIYWNDAIETDEDGNAILDEDENTIYLVKTYDEIVEIAKEILSPIFNEKVTLVHYEY